MTKSVLVYTHGEILGDGIIKLSFIQALKNAEADVGITWLCDQKTVYQSLLRDLAAPWIDHIHCIDHMRDIPKSVKDRRWDVIIDTQMNFPKSFALWCLKKDRFISCAAGGILSSVKVRRDKGKRILEQLIDMGSAAFCKQLEPEVVQIDPNMHRNASGLLPNDARFIGFLPGAGQPFKCWPLENYIKLAYSAIDCGFKPVFILGPAEEPMRKNIEEGVGEAIILPEAGGDPLSVEMSIAVAAQMSCVVSNDSGGGHLAACAQVPMISLIRSPGVRQKFLPFTPVVKAFVPQDFDGDVMADIPFDVVESALKTFIKPV